MALASTEGKLDINLQLDAQMSRVTTVSARVEPAAGVICAQNVRLQAFRGERPAATLLAGLTEELLEDSATYMGRKTVQEIMKTYGPNEDTMLIVFCGKKICAQNRADIFQVNILYSSKPCAQMIDEIDPSAQTVFVIPADKEDFEQHQSQRAP